MDEERQRILDDLMWKGEMAMRDRGLSDAEIAEKKRQLQEVLARTPPDDAGWERLARIDAGEPPESVLPDFGKDAWLVRIAGHRVLLGIGLVLFAAALGYFGGLNRGNTHRLGGIPGLVVGVAIALFAIVYATVSVRRRRRT
jgi:hypothetical protein